MPDGTVRMCWPCLAASGVREVVTTSYCGGGKLLVRRLQCPAYISQSKVFIMQPDYVCCLVERKATPLLENFDPGIQMAN